MKPAISVHEIKTHAQWIAYEAAAWRRAYLEHGLTPDRSSVCDTDHELRAIHQIIEKIADYVPSSYESDRTYNELRSRRV